MFYINTYNLKAQPIFGMETLPCMRRRLATIFRARLHRKTWTFRLPALQYFYVAYSEGMGAVCREPGQGNSIVHRSVPVVRASFDDEQLRAMRLVVDTGLHHRAGAAQQAIDYMLANSSMAESDVVAEVERSHFASRPGTGLQDRSMGNQNCAAGASRVGPTL